jgi:hypothetical protein
VPPEQLLDVRLEDGLGWETICPFLGVEVPNVPYPRINDTRALQKWTRFFTLQNRARALKNMLSLLLLLMLVSGGYVWYMQKR